MIEGVWCFIVCFGWTPPERVPVDSFCKVYERVVLKKEELEVVRKLPRALKDRLQSNELLYLCRCKGWKDQVCKSLSSTGQ